MPPASSHFAERPVPAPPPISGRPAAILARKRSSSACLAMRGMAAALASLGARRGVAPGGDQRVGERFVVDVQRQADELPVGAGAKALLDRREEGAVGIGVVERLARA